MLETRLASLWWVMWTINDTPGWNWDDIFFGIEVSEKRTFRHSYGGARAAALGSESIPTEL